MQKRGFLKSLLGLLVGAPLVSGAGPVMLPSGHSIKLQDPPLAGFQYHAGDTVWPFLKPGDGLRLIREPYNEYDDRAVALHWHDHKLGYIPRRDNAAIAQLLDHDKPLTARIETLQHSDDPWQRIGISSVTLQL
jgi:hypothetical protein